MTADERTAAILYAHGYTRGVVSGYFSSPDYERGLIARNVAEWCGVSLA